MNTPLPAGQHHGYAMVHSWSGYACPALRLYGYRDDLALKRAIAREVRKRAARQPRPLTTTEDTLG